jgi:hypothetical protein
MKRQQEAGLALGTYISAEQRLGLLKVLNLGMRGEGWYGEA